MGYTWLCIHFHIALVSQSLLSISSEWSTYVIFKATWNTGKFLRIYSTVQACLQSLFYPTHVDSRQHLMITWAQKQNWCWPHPNTGHWRLRVGVWHRQAFKVSSKKTRQRGCTTHTEITWPVNRHCESECVCEPPSSHFKTTTLRVAGLREAKPKTHSSGFLGHCNRPQTCPVKCFSAYGDMGYAGQCNWESSVSTNTVAHLHFLRV